MPRNKTLAETQHEEEGETGSRADQPAGRKTPPPRQPRHQRKKIWPGSGNIGGEKIKTKQEQPYQGGKKKSIREMPKKRDNLKKEKQNHVFYPKNRGRGKRHMDAWECI